MKYLSHYTEQKQTDLFLKTGAFFAFSQKQLDEKKLDNITYVSVGAGLIAPEDNVKQLIEGLSTINDEGIAQDIKENGKPAIIQRELANHEAQITGDISDTIDCLADYDISDSEIRSGYSVFFQTCIDNDWF